MVTNVTYRGEVLGELLLLLLWLLHRLLRINHCLHTIAEWRGASTNILTISLNFSHPDQCPARLVQEESAWDNMQILFLKSSKLVLKDGAKSSCLDCESLQST